MVRHKGKDYGGPGGGGGGGGGGACINRRGDCIAYNYIIGIRRKC